MINLYFTFSDKYKKAIELRKNGEVVDTIIYEQEDDIGPLKKLLSKNSFDISDIDTFDYDNENGTFTSLRMAAVSANIFNVLKGNIRSAKELKLPIYKQDPNITKSHKP